MPVTITDSDNILTTHTPERIQANLINSKGVIEDILLEVYFMVDTKLANGKSLGQPYWDGEPLRLNCRGNPKLIEAMKLIQEAINGERNKQILKKLNTKEENGNRINN
jgi:hypothetical protein